VLFVPEPGHPAAEDSAGGYQAGEEQGIRLILGDVNAMNRDTELSALGGFQRKEDLWRNFPAALFVVEGIKQERSKVSS
jgi:hypothetical protein